jgi:hypothetical protein
MFSMREYSRSAIGPPHVSAIHRRTRISSDFLVVLLCGSLAGGCYNSYAVRPSELQKLDGYGQPPKGDQVRLTTAGGTDVTFDRSTNLKLYAGTDAPIASHAFRELHVSDTSLAGVTSDGTNVEVPMSRLTGVELTKFSAPNTTAAIILGTVGVVAGVFVTAFVALVICEKVDPHCAPGP